MILTLTCEKPSDSPASDFGFLLHKNPSSIFEKSISCGVARVFYTEATDERCTAVLTVEVDPIALVRGKGERRPNFALARYVNDRPYAASSLLSVALRECFSTALNGRCLLYTSPSPRD